MQSADAATRNQQIINELKQAIERMSARLTYEIEPAVVFSLKQPDITEFIEQTDDTE